MFAGRFTSSTGPIGIDFGSRGVKMLQAREKSGRVQVIAAARIDRALIDPTQPTELTASDGEQPEIRQQRRDDVDGALPAAGDLGQQIRAAFASGGFHGPRCIVSLAREDVCLQSIRLPRMPDDELRQTALWEASQRFGLDRQAMEVDFIRTGAILQSGESREEVILVAASHAAINARVEPVLAAGLRPIAVDAGFSALVRTFSRQARRESDRSHVRAVVEVGESGSTVLILRGDQVAFCKPIAIGGRHFNQAVADHLQMQPAQAADLRAARILNAENAKTARNAAAVATHGDRVATATDESSMCDPATDRAVYEAVRPLMGDLVKEVTLCLRYYGVTFRGHPPDHIILTGGDGLEPRLGEVMANACKTPVVFDDPNNLLATVIPSIRACLNRTPGPAAGWAVALGLSMRGLRKTAARERAAKTTGEPVRPIHAVEPVVARASGAPTVRKEAA